MPVRPLRSAAASDTGRQRQDNQDTLIAEPDLGLFAVIDGVGGYAGGDVAADLAEKTIRARFSVPPLAPQKALKEALLYANEKIYEESLKDQRLAQMACVATAVLVQEDRLYSAHVGDTRLYKLRPPAAITKLTRDHSLVGLQEDAGELDELAAMRHPRRNEIMRDLGSEHHDPDDPFIDLLEEPFEPDAALLLCSDGLTDLVPRRDLERLLLTHAGHPEDTVAALIEAANEAGGTDNFTVIVVEGRDFPASIAGRQAASARPETGSAGVSRDTAPSLFPVRPETAPPDVSPDASTLPASDAQPSFDENIALALDEETPPPFETEDFSPEQPAPLRSASPYKILALIEALIILALGLWVIWPRLDDDLFERLSGLFESQQTQTQTRTCQASPGGALQPCLNDAQPGDTLLVLPGVYVGPLELRSHVVMKSDSLGAAVLVPGPDLSQTVMIKAENITGAVLSGFVLQADTSGGRPHQTAVSIRDAGLTLKHLVIRGTTRPAIHVEAAPGNQIHLDDLTIMESDGAGIVFQMKRDSTGAAFPIESGGVSLTNSLVTQNGLATNQPGLVIYGAYLPELEGNRIYDNGTDSILVYPDSTSRLGRYVLQNRFTGDETATERAPIRIVWPQRPPRP